MTYKQLLTAVFGTLLILGACSRSEPEAPTASEPMPEPAMEEAVEVHADLRALLASEYRAEADRARDAGRKPADVVEFLGIDPGMRVMDVIAAGGYYTEVLSLAVGPDGEVVAQNPPGVLQKSERHLSTYSPDHLLSGTIPKSFDLCNESPSPLMGEMRGGGCSLHRIDDIFL